jgi:hypothetical protein
MDTCRQALLSRLRGILVALSALVFCCGAALAKGLETPESKCGFAAYKPVRESHFAYRNVLEKPAPVYPKDAIAQGLSGTVNVELLINREGEVELACPLSGPESLQSASKAAALHWRFKRNFGKRATDLGSAKYRVDIVVFEFSLQTLSSRREKAARVIVKTP